MFSINHKHFLVSSATAGNVIHKECATNIGPRNLLFRCLGPALLARRTLIQCDTDVNTPTWRGMCYDLPRALIHTTHKKHDA